MLLVLNEMKTDTIPEYPDNNGNGIPDAFENRPSISEILNPELNPIAVPSTIDHRESEIAYLKNALRNEQEARARVEELLKRERVSSLKALNSASVLPRIAQPGRSFKGSADYGQYRLHIPT